MTARAADGIKHCAEIAVVGGGVIGLCIALWLQDAGRELLLIDRNEPGSGASCGNAGVLANYACVPLGTPGVLRSLPQLLFQPSSPLSISLSALPRLTPWLLRLARASLPGRARRHANQLSELLATCVSAYEKLIELSGAQGLLRHEGVLHLFRNDKALAAASWDLLLRKQLGVRMNTLGQDEIQALEPSLPDRFTRGVLYPDAVHLTDPFELMRLLTRAFIARGGQVLRDEILQVRPCDRGVRLTGEATVVRAGATIIACGAWSAGLARQLGDRIPLETERGYHLEFMTPTALLRRPVCPIDAGFYLTPMTGRLRAAGTVELSDLRRAANPGRWRLIERRARELFPNLAPPTARWLGFRPSLPDSLPVIGRSTRAPQVIYAFGHGHLGVTLAARTAEIVSAMIRDDGDAPDIAGWSPARFA